ARATGPVFSARTASAAALMYWGTPNFAFSPRPSTRTRGAVTPGRSCRTRLLPVRPLRSPRSSRARRRPPLASSIAWPAGVSVLSAKAPMTTQSRAAAAAASRFRVNCRAIDQIPGADTYNRGSPLDHGPGDPAGAVREATPGFDRSGPADAEARPIPAARFRPELPGDPDRAAHGEPGRGPGRRAGRDRRRRPAGAPAAVPAGPAAAGLPAAGAAPGADAGPDAGRRPP